MFSKTINFITGFSVVLRRHKNYVGQKDFFSLLDGEMCKEQFSGDLRKLSVCLR
jgi:hypothetical protein